MHEQTRGLTLMWKYHWKRNILQGNKTPGGFDSNTVRRSGEPRIQDLILINSVGPHEKVFCFLSVLILNLIVLHCFHFLYRGQNQTRTLWHRLAVHLNMNMLLCYDFSWKAQLWNNTLLVLKWRFRQEQCCQREQDCFADLPLPDIVKFWNGLAFIESIPCTGSTDIGSSVLVGEIIIHFC